MISVMSTGDQKPTCSSYSCPISVTLTAADIAGATLSEPLESHAVPALKWWLLCRGLKVPSSWRKQQHTRNWALSCLSSDLVLMSNPSQLTQCNTIPPLANSDHNGILLLTSWKAAGGPSYRRRTIWRYNHANWEGACELINDFDWDSIVSDDVNSSWMKWQHQFLSIMEQCIPQRSLPPRKNLPWMNKNLKQAMRRRNALYKNGKRTGNFSKFKAARNRVVNLLRESKKNYFTKINPRDTKKFWKIIKSLNKTSQSIPTLSHNGVTTNEDTEKANMLNSFFSTCFNTSHPPLSEHDQMPFVTNECPDELLCTVEEVQSLLGSLDTTKATGPDGVSAIMLKRTAPSIAPAMTKLFNLSLRSGQVPTDWKSHQLSQFLSHQIAHLPLITGQSRSFLY